MLKRPLVFDASAMFNFGHRDHLLPVLLRLKAEGGLLVPEAVVEEVRPDTRLDYGDFARQRFEVRAVHARPVDLPLLRRLSARLDRGEIEVILLARETGGTAVIDERLARGEALDLGLSVMGTIGLMSLAIESRWLTEAEALMDVRALRRNGFFLPDPAGIDRWADYAARVAAPRQ